MAGDIYGDGNVLPPLTVSAGDVAAILTAPPATLVSEFSGTTLALVPHTLIAGLTQADTITLDGTFPVYVLNSTLTTRVTIDVDLTAPAYDMLAALVPGNLLSLAETVPVHTLLAATGWAADNELPAHTLSGVSVLGSVITGDLDLPIYTVTGTLSTTNLLTAANTLPAYVVNATSTTSGVGTAALLLPAHQLFASAVSGSAITGANALPVYVLVAGAYGPYTLTADNALPVWQLDAVATSAVIAAFRTWVLNLRKRAMTEYTNLTFNSFAVCDGRLFGASAAGIFELGEQTDDAGAHINALVRTGKHNLGASYAKRMPRAYVAAAAAGDLEFRTLTAAGGRRGYLLPWNQTTEVQQRRVPIGRGPKAVYWQFELANRNGADFQLNALIVRPELNARRVAPS